MVQFDENVKRGTMVECLGVDNELCCKIDKEVKRMVGEKKSLKYIIEWVRDNIQMNESQFAGFMYALGYFAGANDL